MSSRVEILRASLAKKEKKLDALFATYFAAVKAAHGQPLNDKRGGVAVMASWDKLNDRIRAQKKSIKRTRAAIDRAEDKESGIAIAYRSFPKCLQKLVDDGKVWQWGRHPTTVFVTGVEAVYGRPRPRIVWTGEDVAHRYATETPDEQYPLFRDTYNGLRAAIAEENEQ